MTKSFCLFAAIALTACPTDYYVHIDVSDAGVITGTAKPAGRGASGVGGAGGVPQAGALGPPTAGSSGAKAGSGGAQAGRGGAGTGGIPSGPRGGTGPIAGAGGTGISGTPRAGFSIGGQSWYVASWSGSSLYAMSVPWATAWNSGMNIWNPQVLADLKSYSTFRHMDTNATNDSRITSWSQRKLPMDPGNQEIYIDGQSPTSTTGLAVEWQIDLCNRANVDCWFTIPFLANDDYIAQQSALVKSLLKPGLKAYWELGNEVWNGGFLAFNQTISAGQAQNLPGDNKYYQGIAYAMYRTLQMGSIVGTDGAQNVLVFAESGNLDLGTQALKNVYATQVWNPTNVKIDMLALAPYVGSGVDGADPQVLAKFKAEVDGFVSGEPIAWGKRDADKYGIPMLGCYEAGGTYTTNADKFSSNPAAYDAYLYMFTQFSTKMNGPCNLYTIWGKWGSSSAWGNFSFVGQDISQAPKARAVVDWVAAHPR